MSNNIWIDKFKPKKISDIIGNEDEINNIIQWLKQFDTKKVNLKKSIIKIKSSIIISGNHGVGKTTLVYTLLKNLNYEIVTINFTKIKVCKNIGDFVKKLINNNNIINLLDNVVSKKKIIVIDELESIISSTEKNYILSFLKYNEITWVCPIIFISNNQHNKLLSDIKKNSHEIQIWKPDDDDMLILLKRIIKHENIQINDETVKMCIIDHAQQDYRRLIYTLQDLNYAYGTEIITRDTIKEYCTLSKKKDIDFDLFKASELLIYKYKSIDECLKYYETEKVLLPLMLHQNYINSMTSIDNKKNKKEDMDKYVSEISDIAKSLSQGDVIENYIYGDQNWDIHEVHGYYTCVYPSYILNTIKSRKKMDLQFPKDLNKTSIKKINKKNIIHANKCLTHMNIMDYIYINQIIRKLIQESNIRECIKLFKGYNIHLDNIEALLKIDKIKTSKTNLSSKQKKEFELYLNEI
jgi:DNA polymerase III delta prime subunit